MTLYQQAMDGGCTIVSLLFDRRRQRGGVSIMMVMSRRDDIHSGWRRTFGYSQAYMFKPSIPTFYPGMVAADNRSPVFLRGTVLKNLRIATIDGIGMLPYLYTPPHARMNVKRSARIANAQTATMVGADARGNHHYTLVPPNEQRRRARVTKNTITPLPIAFHLNGGEGVYCTLTPHA